MKNSTYPIIFVCALIILIINSVNIVKQNKLSERATKVCSPYQVESFTNEYVICQSPEGEILKKLED